ncbi:MAG: hypothetical protein ACLT3Y_05295 [Ruminococcus callidus]
MWSADSHKRRYENDWVVDILPGNGEYDWDTTIMNAVHINCARMRAVRN